MENTIYLTVICSGSYDDYSETVLFATPNKDKAKNWCDRYNKIIIENEERICDYYDDENYEKPELFWYDRIAYYSPNRAKIIEVELR